MVKDFWIYPRELSEIIIVERPNTNSSAFTTLTVGSTSFSRSSGTFSEAASDPTPHVRWRWDNSANQSTPAINDTTSAYSPFAAVGNTSTLTFA